MIIMKQLLKGRTMQLFPTVIILLLINLVSSSSFITIPALGRIAHFGYLYNEQTGQLGSFSVFHSSNLPNNSILTTEVHSTFTEAQVTSTYADKLQLLNIDLNTGASILSGLVHPVKGSARILKDGNQNDGEDAVTGILLYQHHSMDQDLQIFSQNLEEFYGLNLISQPGTHLVTGISWGLNVAVTFKKGISGPGPGSISGSGSGRSPRRRKTQVRHELEEEFEAVRETAPESEEERGNSKISNFSMRVYSDSALPLSENPRSRRELQEIRNQIPQLIKTTNDGKGVPIQYKLTPLSTIRNYLNLTGHWPLAQEVSESALRKFFPIFDNISTTQQQLRSLQVKLESNLNCLHQNTKDQMTELILNVTEFNKSFQNEFQTILLSIRAGNGTSSELSTLAKSFRGSDYVGIKMRRKMAGEFNDALDKIDFCNNLKELNPEIQIFGTADDLSSKIFLNWNKITHVLFFKSEFIQNNEEAFYKNVNKFLSLSKVPNSQLFAVDCDFDFEQCESVGNTTIRQFVNGVMQDLNLLGKESIKGQEYFGGAQDALVNSTFEWNSNEIQTLRNEINKLKNTCNPNNCKNGGTCVTDGKTFTCQCPPNYHGNTCEQDVNECGNHPSICKHGGTCINKHGSYNCVCPNGLSGNNCEIDIDHCLNVTCLNGGTCHDRVGHFYCECLPEFWGRTCSEPALVQCPHPSVLTGAPRISNSRNINNSSSNLIVTLGCGGLIPLPPQGSSLLVEWTPQNNNTERCLWTLDSSQNGRRYENVTLRLTVLCDGFWLSLHRNRQDQHNRQSALVSHLLQKDTPLEMTSTGFYLSFTSDQSSAGQGAHHKHGFVVGIEVVALIGGRTHIGRNYFYLTSPAAFTYGPYSDYEQVSIGISPSSAPSMAFKVVYSDIDNNNYGQNSNCNYFDALNIFEIRKNEVTSKGRLCGRNQTQPLSFTTVYPILAVFTSDNNTKTGRGFQMLWN